MTAALFQQYVTAVLIQFINRVCTNEQLAGKPAILLMNNCSICARPGVLKMPREHDVKVITFSPHMTQLFQALDLSIFGILKRNLQYKLLLGIDDRVVAFIQKAFHSLKQTFVPDNVRNAFNMLGFQFHIANSPYTLLLREEKLGGSQGFRDIWDGDHSLDQLSKKRREARYGWINHDK
jgi:hypothetical protein